jgi:hypothetical protein
MKTKSENQKKFLQRNIANIIEKRRKTTPYMKAYGAKHGKPNKVEK